MPEDAKRCIESWKKYLPDYQIREWNESNFDINSNLYVKQAYEARKFAFVTDYVRLYALVTEGGVYMDTDVEVVGSYDTFLHHSAFSGFETNSTVPTGMMAAEKGSVWATELLEWYHGKSFLNPDGSYDTTTNTYTITQYMLKKGLKLNNKLQDFPGLITIYPAEYFCPKDHGTGVIHPTDKTVCIHHFAGSWLPKSTVLRHKLKLLTVRLFGANLVNGVRNILIRD